MHQQRQTHTHTHTHTHTRLTALCPGLTGWAGTRKEKPIWILLKQETVSGSGISWAVCNSAPHSRQITTPVPHHSDFFTGRMPFLPPNQPRQSTEGISKDKIRSKNYYRWQRGWVNGGCASLMGGLDGGKTTCPASSGGHVRMCSTTSMTFSVI